MIKINEVYSFDYAAYLDWMEKEHPHSQVNANAVHSHVRVKTVVDDQLVRVEFAAPLVEYMQGASDGYAYSGIMATAPLQFVLV